MTQLSVHFQLQKQLVPPFPVNQNRWFLDLLKPSRLLVLWVFDCLYLFYLTFHLHPNFHTVLNLRAMVVILNDTNNDFAIFVS